MGDPTLSFADSAAMAMIAFVLGLAGPPLRVSYLTCRRSYEPTLIEELVRNGVPAAACSVPIDAAVRVSDASLLYEAHLRASALMDPAYALQILPAAVEVQGDSVRLLTHAALEVLDTPGDVVLLRAALRGSLRIHTLVPDLLCGGRTPRLLRRCEAIADGVSRTLRKRYPCARRATVGEDADAERPYTAEPVLLQLLLLSPERLALSLSPCERVAPRGTWPCWHLAAGLADVDVAKTIRMPSSAYRKLSEALACMEIWPSRNDRVVDLGACPGGWTMALRRLGCEVTAVDRSPLDPILMADAAVTFVQGDAFNFAPSWARLEAGGEGQQPGSQEAVGLALQDPQPSTWMVSDVIAYPERAVELVERWAKHGWAATMIVTMKFQGDEIDWDSLDHAAAVAHGCGYDFRAKHFFSNKNEVTMMLRHRAACGSAVT